jgi:glycerol-3-phosphate acyltransferase PlsX
MRIAVDTMGGDFAPKAIVQGCVEASRIANGRFELVLVGDQKAIETELAYLPVTKENKIGIVHASEKIEFHDSPTTALRKKKDNSMSVAIRLHKQGEVDAVVSAGHTGAMMAASLFGLGRIPGVSRPAIGSFMPTIKGVSLLIDAGANVDCKPDHLLSFGIMGSIFIERCLGIKKPRIGLLNIGEEPNKGNEIVLQTHELFKLNKRLNFIGNIEGRDILRGAADVIVCDGFVGNIVLKFGESFNSVFSSSLRQAIGKRPLAILGALLLRPSIRRVKRIFDWEEYGGVPLLGVQGVSIICHGKSSPKAIRNAILEAEKVVLEKVNDYIGSEIHLLKGIEVEE